MSSKRRDEAWSKDEFMREVARVNAHLVPLHEELLKNLNAAAPVAVVWEGPGSREASYNVHVPHLKREVLRVRATGRLQAGWAALEEDGQPVRAKLYWEKLGQWIPEKGGSPWLSKTLSDIDIKSLARLLQEVALHPPK